MGEFPFRSGKAHLEPFHLAEPSFTFGLGDAGDEVVADLDESCVLRRVRSQERASDTCLSELVV
ncbi:hypothetical protein ADK54_33545 [Streptomyces sp. WM6378]|nr:hypothetical protein ADK54_33545 [Streptomyces sp. WM6378]